MLIRIQWMLVVVAIHAPLWAADNPRHIDLGTELTAVKTLSQNWSDEESNWFYNVPQGSRLIPYEWFLHLEQADSDVRFRDATHIRTLGYIPRISDIQNPDALPVGFIKDEPYEDGTPGLGFTCAACHTSQIVVNRTAYLIDGGPTLGDFERLLKELTAALRTTADNDAKFNRFAAAVLQNDASNDEKNALRATLRSFAVQRASYNDRNLPKAPTDRFGPGRVDAFGAIFNEVSVTFLGIPQNWQAANAPVSYPCLWDAPQHNRVQWNGAAENKVSPLGAILFGTTEVGALGRNSGEVMGVFGSVEINAHELLLPRRYPSTCNKTNLIKIENTLRTLWSPEWPQDAFGPIDPEMRNHGDVIYAKQCRNCHAVIDRRSPDRRIVAHLSDAGTDKQMVQNFGRLANTGRLKGRLKTILALERFGEQEATAVILKHVVERAILDPSLNPFAIRNALLAAARDPNRLDLIDSLNPGYRMTATIEVGDQKLIGQFDSLVADGRSLTIGGGRFHLMAKDRNVLTESLGNDVVDLRSVASLRTAVARMGNLLTAEEPGGPAEVPLQAKAKIANATAKIAYKARPLNGIWATAPYLHNGSVPTLAELLKPSDQRVKTFHVGSQEYDPVNLGFKDDPGQPVYDTSVNGNSNAGHEYGANLSPEERRQLLEYLKSL